MNNDMKVMLHVLVLLIIGTLQVEETINQLCAAIFICSACSINALRYIAKDIIDAINSGD